MIRSAMPKSFFPRLLIWTVICCISAAPSFFWAVQEFQQRHQIIAMLVGIAMFILAYTVITGTEYVQRLNQRPLVRRTAYVGYATRIAISILFPIALALDFACAIVSGTITRLLFALLPIDKGSFIAVLTWTLVQGIVLNVVLLLYMTIVYSFMNHVCSLPAGACAKCGYDLRASTKRCPECGEPFKPRTTHDVPRAVV